MKAVTVEDFVVRDGDERELRFAGTLLASSSSAAGGKKRWIELRLYRTAGGSYVVERVGRSVRQGEKDFHFALVCETAAAVVETLYARDHDGAWFLSNVARRLLEEAGADDDSIREAYTVERVE